MQRLHVLCRVWSYVLHDKLAHKPSNIGRSGTGSRSMRLHSRGHVRSVQAFEPNRDIGSVVQLGLISSVAAASWGRKERDANYRPRLKPEVYANHS